MRLNILTDDFEVEFVISPFHIEMLECATTDVEENRFVLELWYKRRIRIIECPIIRNRSKFTSANKSKSKRLLHNEFPPSCINNVDNAHYAFYIR